MKSKIKILKIAVITFFCLCGLTAAEETYKFERLWPVLPQQWYFYQPYDVTVSSDGYVYIPDTLNNRIQKFTLDGRLVTKWGSFGSNDGEFRYPVGITTDKDGFVYAVDMLNSRIQKFTSDGEFVKKWGSFGSQEGEFIFFIEEGWDYPHGGITADNKGYVYVADTYNDRIQKFTSDGVFVKEWGVYGIRNGEFNGPSDVAVDNRGFVYVADHFNHRIQKFDSQGTFEASWGRDSEDYYPYGISVYDDFVYVSDWYKHSVQKFTVNGELKTEWGGDSAGIKDGQFDFPSGIGIYNGFVYVADRWNKRIQKFDQDGQFVAKWSSAWLDNGRFIAPSGIAADSAGYVYVADMYKDCIQKFSPKGDFILKWEKHGTEYGSPVCMAFDDQDIMYVIEWYDDNIHRIQKFKNDGTSISKWGKRGAENGEFNYPEGIAVDAKNGFVYVADTRNNRIQKFTLDGKFKAKWGIQGKNDGNFDFPRGVAVDSEGIVYVTDFNNKRIQKFTPEGQFAGKWEFSAGYPNAVFIDHNDFVYVAYFDNFIQKFTTDGILAEFGGSGSGPGMLNRPKGLCVNKEGKVYVSDEHARVQIFRQSLPTDKTMKAVIVAGRKSENDSLRDFTRACANSAYWYLRHQGFNKESIYYLAPDTGDDEDNDGESEPDSDATKANLKKAITEWAGNVNTLIVYLVDHGDKGEDGKGHFYMKEGEEFSADELNSWLNSVEQTISDEIIIVIDTCDSGSFMEPLKSSGKKRIVITSTSADEDARFDGQGLISFSNYFWIQIFNGINVGDAFEHARKAMSDGQHPWLDDNGDGRYDNNEDGALTPDEDGYAARQIYIGNGINSYINGPKIEKVSPDQTVEMGSAAVLYAEGVTDDDGVQRVWAEIIPPDYNQESSGKPSLRLPSVDLEHVKESRYEATYTGFNIPGTYYIFILAQDGKGYVSVAKQTRVTVENPLRRRAIIIAGTMQEGRSVMENLLKQAYNALSSQLYPENDIYVMSPVSIPDVPVIPDSPTLEYLKPAVLNLAGENTQDLVLYLTGDGDTDVFKLNDTETLSAAELDSWLDELQRSIPGKVTVIYDADKSGSFIPRLTPPAGKERIVITSTGKDQDACFRSDGNISFSHYFWNGVANGKNVRKSFDTAKDVVEYLKLQNCHLDDNGNGTPNEGLENVTGEYDGDLAENYIIGFGIVLAGAEPSVGSVSPPQTLNGQNPATLWAKNVTPGGSIASVRALIIPQEFQGSVAETPEIELDYNTESGRYEGTYDKFLCYGKYDVVVYAKDTEENVSMPVVTTVDQKSGLLVGDGECGFDLSDALFILKLLAGTDVGLVQNQIASDTDVNKDNRIGLEEAVYILQHVAGLRKE